MQDFRLIGCLAASHDATGEYYGKLLTELAVQMFPDKEDEDARRKMVDGIYNSTIQAKMQYDKLAGQIQNVRNEM